MRNPFGPVIVFINYQGIGDNVLSIPLILEVKKAYPSANILLAIPEEYSGLYTSIDGIRVFAHEETNFPPADLLFDLDKGTTDLKYAEYVAKFTPLRVVGFLHDQITQVKADTFRIPLTDERMWKQYLNLGVQSGVLDRFDSPSVPYLLPSRTAVEWLQDLFGVHYAEFFSLKRLLVCISPSTSSLKKDWPPVHFAEICKYLEEKYSATVALVGTKEQFQVCEKIRLLAHGAPLNLAGKTDLAQMIALVHLSFLAISNDSSLFHIAGACDKPAIAIFGQDGRPNRYQPPAQTFTVIYNIEGGPEGITIADVCKAVDNYLIDQSEKNYWRNKKRILAIYPN